MTDRATLIKLCKRLDNGDNIVFYEPDDDSTPFDIALEAGGWLRDNGHSEEDGIWFGWDAGTDANAFTGGTLTGKLHVSIGGPNELITSTIIDALPEGFAGEIDGDDDARFLRITRPATEAELAYPEPADEAATISRLGRLEEQQHQYFWPNGSRAEDEEFPEGDGLSDEDRAWVDRVFQEGSTKARRQALKVRGPVTEASVDAILEDLAGVSTGDVSAEMEEFMIGVEEVVPERVSEVVDALSERRGWAPRKVAARYLAKREGETGEAAEKLLRKWLAPKQKYENFENVVGGIDALAELIVRRTGRRKSEALTQLSTDESLSEGSRKTARQYIEYALRDEKAAAGKD